MSNAGAGCEQARSIILIPIREVLNLFLIGADTITLVSAGTVRSLRSAFAGVHRFGAWKILRVLYLGTRIVTGIQSICIIIVCSPVKISGRIKSIRAFGSKSAVCPRDPHVVDGMYGNKIERARTWIGRVIVGGRRVGMSVIGANIRLAVLIHPRTVRNPRIVVERVVLRAVQCADTVVRVERWQGAPSGHLTPPIPTPLPVPPIVRKRSAVNIATTHTCRKREGKIDGIRRESAGRAREPERHI